MRRRDRPWGRQPEADPTGAKGDGIAVVVRERGRGEERLADTGADRRRNADPAVGDP